MAEHKNKHIREAIKYAKSRGWTYEKRYGKGHAVGRLRCQFGHHECQMSVWGTPRSPEDHAMRIKSRVDKCAGEDG
jgi:hypothetical protein